MKKGLIFIALFFVSVGINAATINTSLKLLKIEAVSLSEAGGEEVYLQVTDYHSDGEAESISIPDHPTFWPTAHIENVKNVDVWSGDLTEGESIQVIISLMEKDFHPWNVDDLVGTVKFKVRNSGGKLESAWSVPNSVDKGQDVNTKAGPGKKFTLVGEGSRYTLTFALGR